MSNSKIVHIPSVILLDIEGTTTSISFVKDVLFPYARKELEDFLRQHWTDEDIQQIVDLVRKQGEEDVQKGILQQPLPDPTEENDEEILIQSVVANLLWQMDKDRKTTGLKTLQGKIWATGYLKEVLKGHVYEDVPEAFKRWTSSRKKIYIYSSGSVEAQILLFKHSEAGDLTEYLSGHFDTTSGPKVEAQSYINIAAKINKTPNNILFVTDIPKEAYAAKEAGMEVVIMIRPGNSPLTSSELSELISVRSFEEFICDKSNGGEQAH